MKLVKAIGVKCDESRISHYDVQTSICYLLGKRMILTKKIKE